MSLTGRKRYRIENRLFRRPLCVLQLEIKHKVFSSAAGRVRND